MCTMDCFVIADEKIRGGHLSFTSASTSCLPGWCFLVVSSASETVFRNRTASAGASSIAFSLKTLGEVLPFAFTKWIRKSAMIRCEAFEGLLMEKTITTLLPRRGCDGSIVYVLNRDSCNFAKAEHRRASGSPCLTSERSACRTRTFRSADAPFIHRLATRINTSGWSLPMSLRLFATDRRT